MKKVKIMLTAIVIMAVVGGALAFKAKEIGLKVYTCNASDKCELFITQATTETDFQILNATITTLDHDGQPCTDMCDDRIFATRE